MIKKAVFTCIYKDGTELSTNCMVDTEYKEVFDFTAIPCYKKNIVKEYVTIDGKNYPTDTINGCLCLYKD